MSEVTGSIEFRPLRLRWVVDVAWKDIINGRVQWEFRRRIDAIAFARRKGIRLETE